MATQASQGLLAPQEGGDDKRYMSAIPLNSNAVIQEPTSPTRTESSNTIARTEINPKGGRETDDEVESTHTKRKRVESEGVLDEGQPPSKTRKRKSNYAKTPNSFRNSILTDHGDDYEQREEESTTSGDEEMSIMSDGDIPTIMTWARNEANLGDIPNIITWAREEINRLSESITWHNTRYNILEKQVKMAKKEIAEYKQTIHAQDEDLRNMRATVADLEHENFRLFVELIKYKGNAV